MLKSLSRLLQGVLYIAAGINHFKNRRFYLRITPPGVPAPDLVNTMCGISEFMFGLLLLIPRTSKLAAKVIMAHLIVVFPANIYNYTSNGAGMNIPKWLLFIRLPFQFLLFLWANSARK